MVFSSLLFLFLFLPAVLLVYYVSPKRLKNLVLLLASLVFYAWGEPVYIVLMLFATIGDYVFGLLLSSPKHSPLRRKLIVAASIAINLGVLGFFKYADFLISNLNSLLGTSMPLLDLPLPIGISFYTFQSISYIIDVYRRDAEAQRNWLDFAAYISLFPQLVAGPIVQYTTIAKQLRDRTIGHSMFAEGVRRFIIGLAKKVLLANNIGLLWDQISSQPTGSLTVLMAWLGIIAFAFQIYFDFSGYSDMAIGLGLMLGFRFNENFNYPYISQSITEFWRRWHISLGTWFRDYVYIPLGGNRHGLLKQLRNIAIVWMLTGIWHGASWNFLLWGVYFGIILIFEKWFILRFLQASPAWIRHSYALLLILFGWVLFALESLPDIAAYFTAMFGGNSMPLWNDAALYEWYTNAILLLLLIAASIPISKAKLLVNRASSASVQAAGLIWHLLLLLASIAYLVDASFNPFLYFRF